MQTPKAAAEPLLKLLKSAVANAENNHEMDADATCMSPASYANPGPIMKRGHAQSPGQSRIGSTRERLTSPLRVSEKE